MVTSRSTRINAQKLQFSTHRIYVFRTIREWKSVISLHNNNLYLWGTIWMLLHVIWINLLLNSLIVFLHSFLTSIFLKLI
jgi:hypothetical protein